MGEKETSAERIPPDLSMAQDHIEAVFGDFFIKDSGDRFEFNVAAVPQDGGWARAEGSTYPLTAKGIQSAINWAASMNARDRDIYFRTGALRPFWRAKRPHTMKGKARTDLNIEDEDIAGAACVWVDCDNPEHFKKFEEAGFPQESFHVITGTTPHLRRHTYWKLARPMGVAKLDNGAPSRWARLNENVSSFFGSDSSVINPSTYMRLAGFVSYPKSGKEGRKAELVELVFTSNEERSFEELDAAFGGAKERADRNAESPNVISKPGAFTGPKGVDLHVSTTQRGFDELRALLEATKTEGEWHTNMRAAVALMIGWRWNDFQIFSAAIANGRVDGGHGDRDLQRLIDGGRLKWGVSDAGPDGSAGMRLASPDPASEGVAIPCRPLSWFDELDEVKDLPQIVEDAFAEDSLYGVIAPPKSGKSYVVTHLAHSLATGGLWFGRRTMRTPVLYVAAERAALVKKRFKAIRVRDKRSADIAVMGGVFDFVHDQNHLLEIAIQANTMKETDGRVAIIVDTVAQTLGGGNDVEHMPQFVAAIQALRDATNATIFCVHHTSVANDKRARGRSDFTGALDGQVFVEPKWDDEEADQTGAPDRFRIVSGPSNVPAMIDVNFTIETVSLGYEDQWGKPATEGVLTETNAGEAALSSKTAFTRLGIDISKNDQPLKLFLNAVREGSVMASDKSSDWAGFVLAEILDIDVGEGRAAKEWDEEQRRNRDDVRAVLNFWRSQGIVKVARVKSRGGRRAAPAYVVGTG